MDPQGAPSARLVTQDCTELAAVCTAKGSVMCVRLGRTKDRKTRNAYFVTKASLAVQLTVALGSTTVNLAHLVTSVTPRDKATAINAPLDNTNPSLSKRTAWSAKPGRLRHPKEWHRAKHAPLANTNPKTALEGASCAVPVPSRTKRAWRSAKVARLATTMIFLTRRNVWHVTKARIKTAQLR
jgi:hypothetical protein